MPFTTVFLVPSGLKRSCRTLRRDRTAVIEPHRTFSGWLGVFLDTLGENNGDWAEVTAIVEDAYRCVAPKQLIAELDKR